MRLDSAIGFLRQCIGGTEVVLIFALPGSEHCIHGTRRSGSRGGENARLNSGVVRASRVRRDGFCTSDHRFAVGNERPLDFRRARWAHIHRQAIRRQRAANERRMRNGSSDVHARPQARTIRFRGRITARCGTGAEPGYARAVTDSRFAAGRPRAF